MNFFCKKSELDDYADEMGLDPSVLIKADLDRAVEEAYKTFSI